MVEMEAAAKNCTLDESFFKDAFKRWFSLDHTSCVFCVQELDPLFANMRHMLFFYGRRSR